MFKKLLPALSLGLLLSTAASAQFTMDPSTDTIVVNTAGQGTYNSSENSYSNTIDMSFYIKNNSGNAMTFKWTLLSDSTEHPAGWLLTGICDNVICRAPYSPFYYHVEQQTFSINNGETDPNKTLMEARVYAPVGSQDGTGVFRVKIVGYNTSDLNTPVQTTNIVYIVHKNTTGIGNIKADDQRVTLSPNPATNNLQIFTDRNLGAYDITIMNISGAKVLSANVANGAERTSVNVNALSAGTYMVRVSDAKGNMITTRKFIKK